MPLAKINTEEERARLDAIFAEIEAMERGKLFEPEPQQTPQKSAKELRLENRPINEIVGDARSMMKSDVDELLAEKEAAIAELKDVIHELQVDLEGAKATAYAESVDAGMRERKLRRALWIARAWRAKERQRMLPNNSEFYTWQEIQRRCHKKAEEYI